MISVGALPDSVSYDESTPWDSYNLTWSIDGLVNEYLRPCQVKIDGHGREVEALTGIVNVVLDGEHYEAAYTSGGVGSLVNELSHVPNICYKTLRYPGHFKYARTVIGKHSGNFPLVKKEFLEKFATTTSDVIVAYAKAAGKSKAGKPVTSARWDKFYGVDGLTAIQSTTAGSGMAVLELMLKGRVQGIVNHSTIKLDDFVSTRTFKKYYNDKK
jgi:saccharopine dehydrogenase-like NADP-dependent oxidoreductase